MLYDVLKSFKYKGKVIQSGDQVELNERELLVQEMVAAGRLELTKPKVKKEQKAEK